ncbi:hypothetical protein ON010_g9296 [Phytophthora cinnamomi]|nr:hypothetical protein ON010_g9296 [Phytophthora cinnamomi]
MTAGELLFSGQLLAVTAGDAGAPHVQIQKEAISFLQRLAEPVLAVSFHGARHSGKTQLVRRLLGLEEEEEAAPQNDGAWLHVKTANFPNAKYLAILDRPGFEGTEVDVLLYSILAGLSSVVVHHVDGHLTPEAVSQFAFLAANEEGSGAPPSYGEIEMLRSSWGTFDEANIFGDVFNVTTSQLKEQVQESGLSLQETEQTYLCNALAALPMHTPGAEFSTFFEAVFPDQGCFTVPPIESEAFGKRLDKLSRVFTDSVHNRYLKGVVLNGPLIGSIVVSMLAHRDNVFKAFRGRIWKDTIHNCCLNIVENAVKLYKLRMSERLGSIVDVSDLKGFKPALAPAKEQAELIKLPCENDVLQEVHETARREAKANLEQCLFDRGSVSTLLKRFYHHYQTYMFELMAAYTDQAQGPVRKEELAKFMHNVIRPQLAEFSEKLDKVRQHDVDVVEEAIGKKEEEVELFNAKQKIYQKETMDVQEDVNRQLVEGAKVHALRKEALVGAINDLTRMHAMATKQKELLEEAAFVSVQLPEQKVIEAAQDKEVTELQGYLIKQGGGGNVLNPLGRKNWKQRYFILNGANLIYAKTKDDYERGKIIKELCLTGCRIDPSRDAGEGFDITPGKSAHVFELQKGFFEKNSKKRSSAADSGRVFKLRAQTIKERDVWIDKLREAAGSY